MASNEKPKKPQHELMVRRVMLGLCLVALAIVPAVSAATLDLNSTIGPIIDGVVELIPSIVNLIVSIVPAVITLSVVAFIVRFLDRILEMLHI
jgi:hypothetical protein